MADIRKIGSITAGTASTIDKYDVFYDYDKRDTGGQFTVDKNGVNLTEGSASDLFPEDYAWLQWFPLGLEFYSADESLIYYFEPINQWPYFEQKSKANQQADFGDINDMLVTAIVKESATDLETDDGELTFKVYGSNNPFTLRVSGRTFNITTSLGAFNGYTVDVTTGLGAGDHQWQVTDNSGFSRVGIITIPTDEQAGASTYGEKWYYTFKDLDGNDYRVEIHERGYASSSTELTVSGGSPFKLSTRSQGSLLHEIKLFETIGTLELISDSFGKWHPLAEGDDEKYKVKFYNDSTGTNLVWQGFITPQNYSEQYFSTDYITTVVAHDRLGDLSEFKFEKEATIYIGQQDVTWLPSISNTKDYETLSLPILGYFSDLEIIDFCLSNLNMNQGYRVAVNLFETNHNSASTDTPLVQTYKDTRCYRKDDEALTCDEVLRRVLAPYGAFVLSMYGYWYIVRLEDLESASVSYVEYNTALTQTDTGSWSPRVTWNSAGSSSYFRFMGPQTLTFEPVYRNVNIISDYNKTFGNSGLAGNPSDQFWDGWVFHVGNTTDGQAQSFFTNRRELRDGNREWTTGIGRENSYSYWQLSGELEGAATDKIFISFDILPDIELVSDIGDDDVRLRSPYFPLKWQLKVGDYYLDSSGSWGTTEIINEKFIRELGKETKIEIKQSLPDNTNFVNTFNLRIYSGSVFEATTLSNGTILSSNSRSGLRTLIKAVETDTGPGTTGLPAGTRIIGRNQPNGILGNAEMYYYELVEAEDSDALAGFVTDMESFMWLLKPDDFNDPSNLKVWIQRASWTFDYGPYTSDNLNGAYTSTTLKNVEFRVLPSGEEAPDEEPLKLEANSNNKIDLDVELFHFDLSGKVTGDQYIYNNYMLLSDGSQTSAWGASNINIQNILGQYLVEKYSKARQRFNSTFYSDVLLTPLNTLYNTSDANQIMLLTGIEIDFKNQQHSGDIQELVSDNTVAYRDWNADDWDNDDWA